MAEVFANSGYPDQTPHFVASDLGLHCLPITLLRVSRLQWVKEFMCLNTVFYLLRDRLLHLCNKFSYYITANKGNILKMFIFALKHNLVASDWNHFPWSTHKKCFGAEITETILNLCHNDCLVCTCDIV